MGTMTSTLSNTQLGCETVEPLGLPLGEPELDRDVLPLDVAKVAQSVAEGLQRIGSMNALRRRAPLPWAPSP